MHNYAIRPAAAQRSTSSPVANLDNGFEGGEGCGREVAMSDSDRAQALDNLQLAVTAFERQLGALEEVPQAGLEELKGAVDDVRMRIWSVLIAAQSGDYRGFLDRFRLRRAAETLQALAADVDAGVLRLGHREATDLAQAVKQVEKRLKKALKVV
jgi:chemotaxis methyl-accepting protein methylase